MDLFEPEWFDDEQRAELPVFEDEPAPETVQVPSTSDAITRIMCGKRLRLLTEPETRALVRQFQAGERAALDKLITHHLPLVVDFAKHYVDRGVPFDDLVQCGAMGMMLGIERFDLERGVKFGTYVVPYVLLGIRSIIHNDSRTVRLPRNRMEELTRMRRIYARFEETNQRPPTLAETATLMDMPLARVAKLRAMHGTTLSLSAPTHAQDDDYDQRLADTLIDESMTAEDMLQADRTDSLLHGYIMRLRELDRRVMVMRFGLDGSEPMTMKAVGLKFGCTRQYIQYVERRALKDLREMVARDNLALEDLL